MFIEKALSNVLELRPEPRPVRPAPRPTRNKVLVAGVSSRRSLGFAIGERMREAGWDTVLTTRRAERLAEFASDHDVRVMDYPDALDTLQSIEGVTGLVFCLAKTDVNERSCGLLGVSEDNFLQTMSASCYSFIAVVRELRRRNLDLKSIVALSFLGGEQVVPGYEVLGIAKAALEHSVRALAAELGPEGVRVNAVSAGSIPTVSSRVLPDFRRVHAALSSRSFLRRGITSDEISGTVQFLLDKNGSGMTGEVLHVNGGLRHATL